MSSTARDGVRAGVPAGVGEAASLVESAVLLRWRAPELALLLADRAVTAAQDDRMAVLRADHIAVFALNRLGRHGEAARRLLPAIQDEDAPAGLRQELYVELAHCAAALGEPATALEAVCAVLAAGDDVAPVLRGTALVAAAEASAVLDRGDLVTSALDEADELYREDLSLDRDTALLLRATARAVDAARHRRDGATAQAQAQASAGRELLTGLADPEHDSGEVSARLMLELVIALLDRGEGDVAIKEARPLLRRPVRAAAAGAVGRLRLALATRVHLAEGRHEPALTLLADAVEGAQRHGLDAVLADCLEGLSHVHEARGEFADALHCVRAARAAEGRHRRGVEAGRSTLQHWGSARRKVEGMVDQVAALLTSTGAGCAGPDPDNGQPAVGAPAVVIQHRASEGGAQAQAPETEIAEVDAPEAEIVETNAPQTETAETEIAEADAPEASVPERETAETERQEAESQETESRETDTPASVHPAWGITWVEAGAPRSGPADSPAADPVIGNSETGSEETTDRRPVESPAALDTWQSGARHRRGNSALVCVSDLLPPSALSPGRSGRRRAEEPVQEPSDGVPAAEEVLASGPPPAPTPRALEWEPDNAGSEGEGGPPRMGLGDLLAEALAAYRDVRTHGSGSARPHGDDDVTAIDAGPSRDAPRYGRPGARWTSGLQLAASIDRSGGDLAEALTNPLLRLPDLTVEPPWIPPETGRRPAAGH